VGMQAAEGRVQALKRRLQEVLTALKSRRQGSVSSAGWCGAVTLFCVRARKLVLCSCC
jgi:hypothetical protein